MGTLHHHPFFIRYQGGAGDHVVQIRAGRTLRSGVGQSFWLRAGRCALAEVPTANRAHSFLVQATTATFCVPLAARPPRERTSAE